jgi:acetylcholinesterase
MTDYVIYFTRNLDPNGNLVVNWPQYNPQKPEALIFQDSAVFPVITGPDNYRSSPLSFVANLSLLHPM